MPTALIVEDEPEANHLLAMLVQLRGYRTDSAYTGGEALEKVVRQPPDIIFLDLMLPDINGYEVCRSIKDRRATSMIPVVMVTARVAEENRLQSFRVGADDYIPKPYTPDQIYQAMADADAWRRTVSAQDAEGEIRLDARDNGQSLRQIAQLRNLLMGRVPLADHEIARIITALKEIQTSAEAWARSRRAEGAATLAYSFHPDRLTLTIRDSTGWLERLTREDGWAKTVLPAFDQVKDEDNGHRIEISKRFAGPVES